MGKGTFVAEHEEYCEVPSGKKKSLVVKDNKQILVNNERYSKRKMPNCYLL